MTPRRFTAQRPIRLSDTDALGRLRLDAVARYLQDVAADDVLDAGWAPEEHIWVVRRTVIDAVRPFLDDTMVELTTWCGGTAASAALRCTSLTGDRGGHIDAEMTWIHLGPDLQPLRLGERFRSVYGESAAGRRASTRLELPGPPADATRLEWRLRATDVDRLGHVNNAAYWPPVEEHLAAILREPHRAVLEYRQPLDLGDSVELRRSGDGLWFTVGDSVRAAAILGS
ncbi:MAG TPA: acyl-ACP thioesterase domain-containing protein [Gaiellaceae bacterium]|nr:acyl-ACP thioesterase domain-containing protein [Gaiellaceae bacterium]